MSTWDTILDDLQTDAEARLENEAFFSDIVILKQRKGIIESDVQTALSVFNEETGKKIGAVVIALAAEADSAEGEHNGPDLVAIVRFQVIEIPMVNITAEGTNKPASRIALNVLNLLHRYFCGYPQNLTLMAAKKPITVANDVEDGVTSYLVSLEARLSLARTQSVANVSATTMSGELVLSTITEGASIYYTLDGSYPGPENAEAILYTVPFEIVAAMDIRAAAFKTDYIPSGSSYWRTGLNVVGVGDGTALGQGGADTLIGTGEP
jgi:hypothetical protein